MDILRKQIEDEFNKKKYDQTDPFYHDLIESLERKRDEDLEVMGAFENKKKRNRFYFNSKKIISIESQISDSMDMRKNKMMIQFNDSESSSIKHIAVKSKNSIKCTTRFVWQVVNVFQVVAKIFYLFANGIVGISGRKFNCSKDLLKVRY